MRASFAERHRGCNRSSTRASEGDVATFAGIRYGSRLGENLTNWAIFEPNEPHVAETGAEIDAEDPDLRCTREAYYLKLSGK